MDVEREQALVAREAGRDRMVVIGAELLEGAVVVEVGHQPTPGLAEAAIGALGAGHNAPASRLASASMRSTRSAIEPTSPVAPMPPVAPRSPSGIDPLDDAGLLPPAEDLVVRQGRDVEAGTGGVTLDHLGAPREHGRFGGGVGQPGELLAGVGPVADRPGEVGERITDRAQLPVEHGDHPIVGAEHAVVEAVVAVGQPGWRRLGGLAIDEEACGARGARARHAHCRAQTCCFHRLSCRPR